MHVCAPAGGTGRLSRGRAAERIDERRRDAGLRILFDARRAGLAGLVRPVRRALGSLERRHKKRASGTSRAADGSRWSGGTELRDRSPIRLSWRDGHFGRQAVCSTTCPSRSRSRGIHQRPRFEYQVLDDSLARQQSVAPGRVAVLSHSTVVAKRRGRWARGTDRSVIFRGTHCEHWLNGVRIVEFDRDAPLTRCSRRASTARSPYCHAPRPHRLQTMARVYTATQYPRAPL